MDGKIKVQVCKIRKTNAGQHSFNSTDQLITVSPLPAHFPRMTLERAGAHSDAVPGVLVLRGFRANSVCKSFGNHTVPHIGVEVRIFMLKIILF